MFLSNRIHISGGAPAGLTHLSSARPNPHAAMAVLASLGAHPLLAGPAFPPPPNWAPYIEGARKGGLYVGADFSGLPNSDGSTPKVEYLPLTAAAGTDIAAAATASFTLTPTKYFRPGPLIMDNAIAINLTMASLTVGGKPVLAGTGAIPCCVFSHLGFMNSLQSYIATNAAPIAFDLRNFHASATQTVRGVWIGDTQELAVG